jgi:hypothetical protein
VGRKVCFERSSPDYTRKMGAGLFAVMLQTEQELTLFTKM